MKKENGKPILPQVLMTTSNKPFSLREALPSDLPEILQLFENAIQTTCSKDYTQQQIEVWVAGVQNTTRWEKAITQQYFLVAQANNKIVGFASLENGNYLDFLYVHPNYLGQGIAKQLYTALEKKALSLGSQLIYSNVSITAKPFFEKQGFEAIASQRNLIRGVELLNYRMEKELIKP